MPLDQCSDLSNCLTGCQGQDDTDSCRQQCAGRSNSESIAAYNAVIECGAENCEGIEDEAELSACITMSCETELSGCFENGTSSQQLTCSGLYACTDQCPQDDESCREVCLSRATPSAIIFARALAECSLENQCADFDCLRLQCSSAVTACDADTVDTRSLTCAETANCISQCAPENQSCSSDCVDSATLEGPQLTNYVNCLNENQCNDQACARLNCANEA